MSNGRTRTLNGITYTKVDLQAYLAKEDRVINKFNDVARAMVENDNMSWTDAIAILKQRMESKRSSRRKNQDL